MSYFNEMKLVNLTPHNIDIIVENYGDKNVISIKPSGIVPRLKTEIKRKGDIVYFNRDIPFYNQSMGEVENLPEKESGTLYIVSLPVAQACKDRDDLIVPKVVRDENGRIIGCDGFLQIK